MTARKAKPVARELIDGTKQFVDQEKWDNMLEKYRIDPTTSLGEVVHSRNSHL